MTLSAGTRLGPYEIQSAIGASGMGEVYRAHDPRLGRDVAVTPCMTQIYDLSDPVRDAGCRVYFYQGLRWSRLHRLNNRTHREILVIDGRVAFVGGAGVADWWAIPRDRHRPWRDTMARVENPIVA